MSLLIAYCNCKYRLRVPPLRQFEPNRLQASRGGYGAAEGLRIAGKRPPTPPLTPGQLSDTRPGLQLGGVSSGAD